MILRRGSQGEQVKTVQRYLGLVDDGDFGPRTEAAVKAWQTANGLVADGVVGSKTWNAMGLATTDITEHIAPANTGIEFKKEYLPRKEYFPGPVPKDWIFLHHTAGWNDPYATIKAWGRDTRGAVATEWVLGGQKITDHDDRHDGVLVQAFPEGGYGWHLGTGNNVMHRNSVGIEVCNFGYLTQGGYWKWNPATKKNVWIQLHADRFYTYVGTEVDAASTQLVTLEKPFRGHRTWHRYSDTQIEVIKDWLLFIANRDNIDIRKGLPELILQKGAAAFDFFDIKHVERNKGLWSHTNVRRDKFDMFPQPELLDMLTGL